MDVAHQVEVEALHVMSCGPNTSKGFAMTLTERERLAVENGNARSCIMCRRIAEAWQPEFMTHPIDRAPKVLIPWRDEVVTFGVDAQKFHISQEMTPWDV